MKKSRFTEEQIIRILKEGELGGKVDELCRRHNISKPTYYNWKSKYGGLELSELKKAPSQTTQKQQKPLRETTSSAPTTVNSPMANASFANLPMTRKTSP